MVGNNNVLIVATISNGEAPSVVGVELAHMFNMDVQFIVNDRGRDRNCSWYWWGSGRSGPEQSLAAGGANTLAILLQVDFEGLIRIGENFEVVGVGEAWPR